MAKRKSSAAKAKEQATIDENTLLAIMRGNDGGNPEDSQSDASSRTTDSFVNYQQNMGVGADNPLTSATYGFNPITRQRTVLEWMYRGSWLAGKLVDTIAEDMTRTGAEMLGEMQPKDISRANKFIKKHKIWHQVSNAIKWGRLYGGSLLVMLIDDQKLSDPLDFDKPLTKGSFKGVLALDRWMVEPDVMNLVTDLGPDLGLPKWYRLNSMAPVMVGQKIHYSRVIRFTGIEMPYWQSVMENLWGESILERVWDRLISFDSATTGAAQLVYKAYLRNYKIKGFREIQTGPPAAMAGLTKQINMMRHFQNSEGMTLMDMEDELVSETHGAFGGLSDILIRFMEQCSGAEQIPLVRLFGQSPSGFSTGDTDLRNYYDTIDLRRSNELETAISNIYKLVLSSLGIKIPDDFDIEFGSLWQMNDTEKSELANQHLETVARAEEAMLIDKPTALKELKQMSKKTGVFTNVTDDMIKEAELEPPPSPEGMEQDEQEPNAGNPTFSNQLHGSDLANLKKQNSGGDNGELSRNKTDSSGSFRSADPSKLSDRDRHTDNKKLEEKQRTGDTLDSVYPGDRL